MPIATNILRRPGSRHYQVRVYVPKDLQARMGKPGKPLTQIWKSLSTPDAREAKRLARPIVEQWEREFEERRQARQLTDAEFQNAVWRRYQELINADERFRLTLPSDDDLNEIWKHLEAEFGEYDIDAFRIFETIRDTFEDNRRERSARLAQLRAETAEGKTKVIADAVLQVIEDRQLGVDIGSPEYRRLAQGLQRAELEGLMASRASCTRPCPFNDGDGMCSMFSRGTMIGSPLPV